MNYTDRIRKLIEEIRRRNSGLGDSVEIEKGKGDIDPEIESYFVDPNEEDDGGEFYEFQEDDEGDFNDSETVIFIDENTDTIIDVSQNEIENLDFSSLVLTTGNFLDKIRAKFLENINEQESTQEPSDSPSYQSVNNIIDEVIEISDDEFYNEWTEEQRAYLKDKFLERYTIEFAPWPSNLPMDLFYDLTYFIELNLNKKKKSIFKLVQENTWRGLSIFSIIKGFITTYLLFIYFKRETWQNNSFLNELSVKIGAPESLRVKKYISNWIEHFKIEASEETCTFYGLTKYGTPYFWWDPDGELRESGTLSDWTDILVYLKTRQSSFLDVPEFRKRTIFAFIESCRIIQNELKDDKKKWPQGTKTKLNRIFNHENKKRLYVTDSAKDLLNTLFKYCEGELRFKILSSKGVNTDKEKDTLARQLRDNVFKDINKYFEDYRLDDMELDEAFRITNKSEKFYSVITKVGSRVISEGKYDDLLKIIDFSKGIQYGEKLLSSLLGNSDKTSYLIISIALNSMFKISGTRIKQAKYFAHKSRMDEFQKFIDEKIVPSKNNIKEIIGLTEYKRKEIKLDIEKIDRSRDELSSVIEKVKTIVEFDVDEDKHYIDDKTMFINDTETEVIELKTENVESKKSADLSSLFNETELKLVQNALLPEGIELRHAEELIIDSGVFLSSWVESINEKLFERFEDQVLIMENDRIIVDEYYKEELLEIINGT